MAATVIDSIVPRPLDYVCQVQYSLNPDSPLLFSFCSPRCGIEEECIQETWKEFLRRIVRIRGICAGDLTLLSSEFGKQCAEQVRKGDVYNALCDQPLRPKRMVWMMNQYMANHRIDYRIHYLYYNPAEDWYIDATRANGWASKEEVEKAIRRTEDPTF